jgi:hypothetical protein
MHEPVQVTETLAKSVLTAPGTDVKILKTGEVSDEGGVKERIRAVGEEERQAGRHDSGTEGRWEICREKRGGCAHTQTHSHTHTHTHNTHRMFIVLLLVVLSPAED